MVRELGRARLLGRPQVVEAVDTLLAEGRAVAEGRLYAMVRGHRLPEPVWNVCLRLPGGPLLGGAGRLLARGGGRRGAGHPRTGRRRPARIGPTSPGGASTWRGWA